MRYLTSVILAAVLSSGISAPVDVKENGVDKRRDSTKETMELEDALKRLSGENKKFYPPLDGKMQPQVDGLDPPSQDEDESQLFKLTNAQQDSAESNNVEEEDQESDIGKGYEQIDNQVSDLDSNGYLAEEDEDKGPLGAEDMAQGYPMQYVDYGIDPYQDYYADHFGESENRLQAAYPQYGSMQYAPEPARETSEEGGVYPGIQPQPTYDEKQDYLLQNMLQAIQERPELMGLLEQGRDKMLEEGTANWNQDEEDLDQLGRQPAPGDLDHMELHQAPGDPSQQLEALGEYSSISEDSDEDETSVEEAQYDALSHQLAMQQTGNSMDDLEKSLQNKAMIQQLETLQELYGDKGAHSVAKKMGYHSPDILPGSYYSPDMLPGSYNGPNSLLGNESADDPGSGELHDKNALHKQAQQEEETLANLAVASHMKDTPDFRQMSIM